MSHYSARGAGGAAPGALCRGRGGRRAAQGRGWARRAQRVPQHGGGPQRLKIALRIDRSTASTTHTVPVMEARTIPRLPFLRRLRNS